MKQLPDRAFELEPTALNETFPGCGRGNSEIHNGWEIHRSQFSLSNEGKVSSTWFAWKVDSGPAKPSRIFYSLVGSEGDIQEARSGISFDLSGCVINNTFLYTATRQEIQDLIDAAKRKLIRYLDSMTAEVG